MDAGCRCVCHSLGFYLLIGLLVCHHIFMPEQHNVYTIYYKYNKNILHYNTVRKCLLAVLTQFFLVHICVSFFVYFTVYRI